jgi:hypothetical protein
MPRALRSLPSGVLASLLAALLLTAGCTGHPPGPTTETTPAGNSAGQTQARPSTAR